MMPKKKIKDSDGSLPEDIIKSIWEYTPGGFVIFYFNQETGQPEQAMNFDSPAYALALQKYIADFDEAIHQVNINNCIRNIKQTLEEDEGDDSNEKS